MAIGSRPNRFAKSPRTDRHACDPCPSARPIACRLRHGPRARGACNTPADALVRARHRADGTRRRPFGGAQRVHPNRWTARRHRRSGDMAQRLSIGHRGPHADRHRGRKRTAPESGSSSAPRWRGWRYPSAEWPDESIAGTMLRILFQRQLGRSGPLESKAERGGVPEESKASVIHKHLNVISLLGACLAIAACASRPVAPTPAPSGRQLVQQKCAGCHAISLDDASPNPGAPPLRTLYRRYPIDALNEAFTKGMKVGHRDMPRFTLSRSEVRSILSYLRSLDPCGQLSSDAAAMARCFEPMEQ